MAHNASERATIARVEADLLSGRYFNLRVASHRSVPLGGPPIAARHWAQIMRSIATYATQGDRAAATAALLFGKVNQYLTPNEVIAQVAERLAGAVRDGWYDVRTSTGPEAGRPSSHEHPTTLRDALNLAMLMTEVEMNAGPIGHVPGPGWVLTHLLEREGVVAHGAYYPALARLLDERSNA